MITRCVHCGERIRDCTSFALRGVVLVTVPGWYHVGTGWETCESGLAWPVYCVGVSCAEHDKDDDECRACETSAQVSLFFHNDGRCVEAVCRYPHA